ncbi:polysaccharide deacetylase [Whalleya microplaca]|nr:polysaccharide deacetylase [Whalleya microplaca]
MTRPPLLSTRQSPSGRDTRGIPRPEIGNVSYEGVDITGCTIPGKVALTFDDGPYIYTNELLDLLESNNVKATFFLTGNNDLAGQRGPGPFGGNFDVLKRMHANGHQLGSHTWSHKDLTATSPEETEEEIIWNEMAFVEALGFFPTYFRPPYTSCGWDCAHAIARWGYHMVSDIEIFHPTLFKKPLADGDTRKADYNIDTKDYLGDYDYARSVFSESLKEGNPKSDSFISLSHDIWPDTVHTLVQFMINTTRSEGYQLVTLGECVGDPVENWYRNPDNGGPMTIEKAG